METSAGSKVPMGNTLGGEKNMGFEESLTLGENERLLSQALDKPICCQYLVGEDDCKHPFQTNPVRSRRWETGIKRPIAGG